MLHVETQTDCACANQPEIVGPVSTRSSIFNVKKRESPEQAKQIFQRPGYVEIHVQSFHINRTRAAILVIVHERPARPSRAPLARYRATSDRNPFLKQICVSGTIAVRSSTAFT